MIVWDFTYSASMSIYPSYDKTPQKRFWWIRYNTIYFEILTCRKTQITLTNRTLLTWWHFILLRTSRKIRNHQMTKKKRSIRLTVRCFKFLSVIMSNYAALFFLNAPKIDDKVYKLSALVQIHNIFNKSNLTFLFLCIPNKCVWSYLFVNLSELSNLSFYI